ncbi:MAG: hypothetical protein ABIS17_12620 [Casimicrobiaceae bacterium]
MKSRERRHVLQGATALLAGGAGGDLVSAAAADVMETHIDGLPDLHVRVLVV